MNENDQRYSDQEPEESLSNRRYGSLERLVGWSQRSDDRFLFFRVKSFREVTLPSGEKLEVPEKVMCAFADREVEPDFDGLKGDSAADISPVEYKEYATDESLVYHRARSFDSTTGRWIAENPLGYEPATANVHTYPSRSPSEIQLSNSQPPESMD